MEEQRMANNEFNNIEEFIEGFTRKGQTPEKYTYDGIIWGIEFFYIDKYYRITRDPVGLEKELRIKFKKKENAFITFFEIPKEQYPNSYNIPNDNYLGIYDDVNDLLDNAKIDGVPLRVVIPMEETTILAID